ncbi:MAG: phosphotransferase [Parvibaculaceae bacterium]
MFRSIAHDRDRIAGLAVRLAGGCGTRNAWREGCAAHASPSWRGIDAAGIIVTGERPLFAKAYYPEIALYAHLPSVMAAARHAGGIGVGPRVMAADADHGLVVMEPLVEGWRSATLADIAPSGAHGLEVLALRKSLHDGPKLPRDLTVFEHIGELDQALLAAAAYRPADYDLLIAGIRRAGAAVNAAGFDRRPAHGDGNASNIMIHEDGSVRLVDYDLAANRDPYEDFASHLVEAFWFPCEAAPAFEAFHGHVDGKLLARIRLYGVADDLRWAMIGLLTSHHSPRRAVEYLKFAEWRLLRARMAMRHPDFETLAGSL